LQINADNVSKTLIAKNQNRFIVNCRPKLKIFELFKFFLQIIKLIVAANIIKLRLRAFSADSDVFLRNQFYLLSFIAFTVRKRRVFSLQ